MQEEKRFISSEILFSAMEELLAENRQAVFTVTGMSMWPFLCHGRDQVVVEQCDCKTIKKGDIVLFRTETGKYLLHRITALGDGWFESTGDGNCFRDGKFPLSCIRARIVRMIRDGKTIDCNFGGWKIVFQLWMICFPVRGLLLKTLVLMHKMRKKYELVTGEGMYERRTKK